ATVARVSGRLREIARQTVAIAESGEYVTAAGQPVSIAAAVRAATAGTRLYEPEEPLPGGAVAGGAPAIEVTREAAMGAARRLGDYTATLVFASAKNPGGGFLGGAQAQEESLARASALYACQRTVPEFYDFHRQQGDLRYSDRVIYSPAVPVFRDDTGTLLEEPYPVSFLTCAAPNLGAILRNQPGDAGTVPDVLAAPAGRVLRIAAARGHRRLGLGAWGCGVFGNDPAVVAAAFAGQIVRAGRWFDRIVFPVHDRQAGTPAYTAFARTFRS